MACLGVEPGAAEWKAQTNPLSYGGTLTFTSVSIKTEENPKHNIFASSIDVVEYETPNCYGIMKRTKK